MKLVAPPVMVSQMAGATPVGLLRFIGLCADVFGLGAADKTDVAIRWMPYSFVNVYGGATAWENSSLV